MLDARGSHCSTFRITEAGFVDIGLRLQAVRKAKGLSQRELAKRVGVTNSTISLIEQNKVSPSISSRMVSNREFSASIGFYFFSVCIRAVRIRHKQRLSPLPNITNHIRRAAHTIPAWRIRSNRGGSFFVTLESKASEGI